MFGVEQRRLRGCAQLEELTYDKSSVVLAWPGRHPSDKSAMVHDVGVGIRKKVPATLLSLK